MERLTGLNLGKTENCSTQKIQIHITKERRFVLFLHNCPVVWTFPPLWRIHLLVMHGKRHTNFKVQYVKTKQKSGWEVNYSDQNVKKWQFWGRHANQLATALLAEHSTRAPRSQSAPLAAQLTEYLANGSYSRRQLAVTPPPFSFRARPVLTYCTFNSRVFWMSLRDNSTAHYPPSFKVQIKEHKKKKTEKQQKEREKSANFIRGNHRSSTLQQLLVPAQYS